MIYRKIKADHLFTGTEMTGPDKVLILDENGVVQAIQPASDAGEAIEHFKGILCPGFINCHCHLELSHLQGLIPEKTGLVDFLLRVMERHGPGRNNTAAFPEETILDAIAKAETAMLDDGIVAVGDICNTTHTLPQKKMGRLYYHNFIEVAGFSEQRAPERFAGSLAVFQAFAEAYALPVASNSLVPHAPYSVSPALFRMIANFPGNQLLTIHNQESEAENEFYLTGKGDFLRLYEKMGLDVSAFKGTGKRSLESCLPYFFRNQSQILVHNVATNEADLLRAAESRGRNANEIPGPGQTGLFYCLCPNANLYISGKLPDVDLFIRHNCTIVVGTDSLASNHQLSILEELKTIADNFPHLPTDTLLAWATYNGALALQLDEALGSFEPGRQPGVLLIEGAQEGRLGQGTSVRRLM